jgi:hypothetical protein
MVVGLRVCMNPDCNPCVGLKPEERPFVLLAKTCWNCHKSEFLVDL